MKHFRKVADRKVQVYVETRPTIELAEEFMKEFTFLIRRQFCPDWSERTWCQNLWMVRRAVTYPAEWLNERRLFVSAKRYREILMTLILDIKRNATGEIGFPPGYLLKCIQDHFRFHADEYNAEGKAARDAVARVLEGAKVTTAAPADDFVQRLADAHRLIKKPGRAKKAKPAPVVQVEKATPQPTLFDL